MEGKDLMKGSEVQSKQMDQNLSSSRTESEERPSGSDLNRNSSCFHRVLEKANFPEGVDPEILKYLKENIPEPPKQNVSPPSEMPVPKDFEPLEDGALPNLPVDPELERSQYERVVGHLLTLAGEIEKRDEGLVASVSDQTKAMM